MKLTAEFSTVPVMDPSEYPLNISGNDSENYNVYGNWTPEKLPYSNTPTENAVMLVLYAIIHSLSLFGKCKSFIFILDSIF